MSLLATVIGDCELFSVITEQVSWTFSKWFHNIGLGNVGIFDFSVVFGHTLSGN